MIKKLVCAVLAISMFIASVGLSVAENVDVSSLSDEELLSLRERVLAEVTLRKLDSTMPYGHWYNSGLGQYVPNPSILFERETKRLVENSNNDNFWFIDNVASVTPEEFQRYVAAVIDYGFNQNLSSSEYLFEADSGDGLHVTVQAIGYSMMVAVKKK